MDRYTYSYVFGLLFGNCLVDSNLNFLLLSNSFALSYNILTSLGNRIANRNLTSLSLGFPSGVRNHASLDFRNHLANLTRNHLSFVYIAALANISHALLWVATSYVVLLSTNFWLASTNGNLTCFGNWLVASYLNVLGYVLNLALGHIVSVRNLLSLSLVSRARNLLGNDAWNPNATRYSSSTSATT